MADSPYERYVIRRPTAEGGCPGVQGRDASCRVFLSDALIPASGHYLDMTWIDVDSEPGSFATERVLEHDQLILSIGMDWRRPQRLGATVEFYLGGQPISLNTTSSVFIPKGTPFGPLSWKDLRRPYVMLCLVFGSGETPVARWWDGEAARLFSLPPVPVPGTAAPGAGLDYEQYVVRSPLREAGPVHVDGRQNPTMTYLSANQIPGLKTYLEFGWIWDVPQPPIPKMRHDDFDEIVVHIGSDPDYPEDLGGTLQFGMGEDLLEFDTTHCAYLPRGLDHGPLSWKEVRRPLIEMAFMLGAGTLEEGWANSFFDLPEGGRRGPK
jgi:hypothetical protein